MLGLDLSCNKIVVVLACHLAVCGRADGRDVVVDGMLWRTAGKSACYAGELVASGNSQCKILCRWNRLQLVSTCNDVQTGQQ